VSIHLLLSPFTRVCIAALERADEPIFLTSHLLDVRISQPIPPAFDLLAYVRPLLREHLWRVAGL
jgi:hypothetical protein